MAQLLPLDQIYKFMKQPQQPQIEPSIFGEQSERAQTVRVTSDFFRDVAGQLNTFANTKTKQTDAYTQRSMQRTADSQQRANQNQAANAAVSMAEEDNMRRATKLTQEQMRLEELSRRANAVAQQQDDSGLPESAMDAALGEEATRERDPKGEGGFWSGLKDLGQGTVNIARGVGDVIQGPIEEFIETPFEVGRELVTGGGMEGVKRELAEGVAPIREPIEAAIEIGREAIRGDLQGLWREMKEAGREVPQVDGLVRAWDGLNQVMLGEQKLITPITMPIFRETMKVFGVPDGRAQSIANIFAEIIVPTTFIPYAGTLGRTKGAIKLLKVGMAEGLINMLQNKAGFMKRDGRDTTLIEDVTMFTFGLGGRIGMEYAARGLTKFLATPAGQTVKEGVASVVRPVKEGLGKAKEVITGAPAKTVPEGPTKYYHGTDPASGDEIMKGGFRPGEQQFVTTDPDLAYQFALRKSDTPVVIEVSTREGVELGGREAIRNANPEDLIPNRILSAEEVKAPSVVSQLAGEEGAVRVGKGDAPSTKASPESKADEDMLELEHYSSEKLDEIDPSFAGTGKAGEEANIGGPRVSHYYLSGSKPERMIVNLPNKMTVKVAKADVLDLVSEDGIELIARAKAMKEGPVVANMGDTRQLAMDDGWRGIYNSEDPLKRVQLFETTKVIPDAEPGVFSNAIAHTKTNKGGTFDPKTGESISFEGHHVGGGVPTKTIPLEEFNEAAMDTFVRENAEVFNDPAMKVGTEVVDNAAGRQVVNLDATSLIKGREEALTLAQTRGEQRVWDTAGNGGKGASFEVPGVKQTQTAPTPEVKAKGRTPNEDIRTQASEYAQQNNLSELTDLPYAKVDEARAGKIADAYEAATHTPNDPKVKKAYDAFKEETHKQWEYLKAKGIKFTPWTEKGQPYADSAAMRADIADNQHLSFFQGGELAPDHPMAAKVPGSDLTYNDEFRAVHDYFGHAKEGYQFGPRGEENAWRTHSQMYSDEARKALTTETRGQNSWVNFGPEGKANRADPSNTVFPEQKAVLLADEFAQVVDDVAPKAAPKPKAKLSGEEGAVRVGQPDTKKPSPEATAGDEVVAKLADYTPAEKAHVRSVVTATRKEVGAAAHAFISKTGKAIVQIYEAIKKMGRTFNNDEIGALRYGNKDDIHGVTFEKMMNVAASRRWLQPDETWKQWSQYMSKRIGGKEAYWGSSLRKEVRLYTEHMMGLLGDGPIGGNVKRGDKMTARFGPSAHPRTQEELMKLVEEGTRLSNSAGERLNMKKWYNQFHKFMQDTFGKEDAEMITMFAAATQANQGPAGGVSGALRAFMDWKLGMPISGQSSATIRKMMENIVRGGIPKGPKITPFWEALRFSHKRGTNAVAVDRWMFAAIGAQQGRWKNLASNDRFIRFTQQLIKEAAKDAGISPRAFQAAVWGGTKADWNKLRAKAGQRVLGEDFTFFQDLFAARMKEHGLRAPKDFQKLAAGAEAADEELLERFVIDGLEIAKPGESRAARSARITELMYAEWNGKVAAAHLLETGEILPQLAGKAREDVVQAASIYKRSYVDRIKSSDKIVLTKMQKKGHLTNWQKTILDAEVEARVSNAPTAEFKKLPAAERARHKTMGYQHVKQTVGELKRVHNAMLELDKIGKSVPKLNVWLKANKDLIGEQKLWSGKSIGTGVYYEGPAGMIQKHEMSPYWEPKPYYESGYLLNIPQIKATIRGLYPDQRFIDGTKQIIGDALKINKKSPVGSCA